MKTNKQTNKQITKEFLFHLQAKKLFLFNCFLFFGYFGWSQTLYSYYLVEEVGSSLEPLSKIQNSNGTISLSFTNSSLHSFFQTKTIYQYEKAFPNELSSYLERVYKVSFDEPDLLNSLKLLDNVEYTELVQEGEELFEPNDYYYMNEHSARSNLKLIRAPKAWDITKGDSTILVGIIDTRFSPVPDDLKGKFHSIIDSTPSGGDHGIKVASMVAANTDNSIGVAAVGFNTKMIGMANGLNAAQVLEMSNIPNIRIINISWHNGFCNYSPIEQEIFKTIRRKNILVVAAAGNGSTCGGPNNYVYPAAYEDVLAVSSVGHSNPVGFVDPVYGAYDWSDVHQNIIDPLNAESNTHQHNDMVDLVAPGYRVWKTNMDNTYSVGWGTSFSSPTVAGAAALVLSINPNLTANQLENIIKTTTDDIFWIPYNTPYIGKLGTGRLNVFRAVKTAECMDVLNPKVNLAIRDTNEDLGLEPNNLSSHYNNSLDIWVRNQNDGRYYETHQNVEYDPINPNYVYVRVTNYGCKTSSGTDVVNLYWSVAAASQPWPSSWDGSFGTSTTPLSGLINSKSIPVLAPGQEIVLEFEWFPPNPTSLPGGMTIGGNFSLLTRIISTEDPINFTNGTNILNYVKNNSNVAWKNIHVVNISPISPILTGSINIINYEEELQTYSIELVENTKHGDKPIYEEAEISIKLNENIYNSWIEGGSIGTDIISTNNENIKIIDGDTPILSEISLEPGEMGHLEITFNFLTKELTDKENYKYELIQKNKKNGEIIGNTTIYIKKENRQPFYSNAQVIQNENSSKLIAEDIGEPAIYNWYNSNGNLIYSGSEFSVNTDITKTYRLETTSELDGFKDYKEIEVIGANDLYSLNTIQPNPANSQVIISYNITSASTAYLIITNLSTNTSNNYVLNPDSSSININLSNYVGGIYTVSLICNGNLVDSKNLIKN
jgi:subtilisin family serine protease